MQRYIEMGYSREDAEEAVERHGDDLHAGCHWLMMRETMGRVPKRLKTKHSTSIETYLGSRVQWKRDMWHVVEYDSKHALVCLKRANRIDYGAGRWVHLSDARIEWVQLRHNPLKGTIPKASWRRCIGTINISLKHMDSEKRRQIDSSNALSLYIRHGRPDIGNPGWNIWRAVTILTREYIHTPTRPKPRNHYNEDMHDFRVELMTYFHALCDMFHVSRDAFNDKLYAHENVLDWFPPSSHDILTQKIKQWENPIQYLKKEYTKWCSECLPLFEFKFVKIWGGNWIMQFQVFIHDMTFVRPSTFTLCNDLFQMQRLFFTLYPKSKPEYYIPGPMTEQYFENVLHLSRKSASKSTDVDPTFVQQLFPYQQKCLQWLIHRETHEPTSSWGWSKRTCTTDNFEFYTSVFGQISLTQPNNTIHGGILAQEVGMGKTWEILALIATEKTSDPTMVIVPTTMLSVWMSEAAHCVPSLKIIKYHGARRTKDMNELRNADIVLTTYRVVVNETQQHIPTIGAIRWGRIVLDESHEMKGASTSTCRAICRLFAPRRWCVSATPWPKGMASVVGILSFLGVTPFDESQRDYMGTQQVHNTRGDNPSIIADLLKTLTWWQRKRHVRLKLPPVCQQEVILPQMYPELYKHMRECVYARVELDIIEGQTNRRARCLHYIRWLRQAATDLSLNRMTEFGVPMLVNHAPSESKSMDSFMNSLGSAVYDQSLRAILESWQKGNETCSICMDAMDRPTLTPCNHLFCYECIQTAYEHDITRRCPLCRASAGTSALRELTDQENDGEITQQTWHTTDNQGRTVEMPMDIYNKLQKAREQYGGKFNAILNILKEKDEKIIIFTQFHNAWRKVCEVLKTNGIEFASIEGKMTPNRRAKAIHNFQNKDTTRVFVMTTKTASVGITLTAGSHIIFLEPCHDEHIRKQAIGRAWRIGQMNPVTVTTLKSENTIDMVAQKDIMSYIRPNVANVANV